MLYYELARWEETKANASSSLIKGFIRPESIKTSFRNKWSFFNKYFYKGGSKKTYLGLLNIFIKVGL